MWSSSNIIQKITRLISLPQKESILEVRFTNYNANRGVFNNSKNFSIIKKDEVLSLYPGMYVPPLTFSGSGYDHEDSFVLLKRPTNDATYVINSLYGGYINAINEAKYNYINEENTDRNRNDIALGHLINHASGKKPNVEAFHFAWKDVLQLLIYEKQEKEQEQGNEHKDYHCEYKENYFKKIYNINYLPKGEWYFDTQSNNTVHFPDRKNQPGEYLHRLKGIALVSIRDIVVDEELLLDYDLRINHSNSSNNNNLEWYKPALKL